MGLRLSAIERVGGQKVLRNILVVGFCHFLRFADEKNNIGKCQNYALKHISFCTIYMCICVVIHGQFPFF